MTTYERHAHREAAELLRKRKEQRFRILAILTGTMLTTAVITAGVML